MATADALRKHYYGDIKLPRGFTVHRHFGKRSIWAGFSFSTNFWQLRAHAYSKWVGGFHLDMAAPTWIPGWAKYGMLNRLVVFGPKPNMDADDCFPVLLNLEHWSEIVTDKELAKWQ